MRDPATKKSRRLFRPWEADEIRQNKKSLQNALESPYIEDKAAVRDAMKRMDAMEREHGVPTFSADEKDKAAKKVKELEEQMKEGMLSFEEMRRNPPGAVDQNVWWEKRNKKRVNLWRNLNAALHPGIPADQAEALFSPERLRPRTSRLNMDNAEVPAVRSYSFPTREYQENYEKIFRPKQADEPSVLDEPEEPTAHEMLLQDAGIAESLPETQKALGILAKGRGKSAPA